MENSYFENTSLGDVYSRTSKMGNKKGLIISDIEWLRRFMVNLDDSLFSIPPSSKPVNKLFLGQKKSFRFLEHHINPQW